jgi:predicted DNA-binding transcriptional regulator AlpA
MTIPEQISPPHLDAYSDRVMTFPEFCKVAGFSIATLRRLIHAGEGPPVTHLSTRRLGIRVRNGLGWLDSRTRQSAA